MPLSNCQQIVADAESRFRVVVAGRRWGKTFLSMNEIAKVARHPDKNVYAVYPSYRQAKSVLWEPLKKRLLNINWVKKINETDLSIILRNDSKISLRGSDNFDSLRGVGLDAAILDEFQLIDEKAWYEVLRPALSDKEGSALFIGTPYGTANWAFDLYNKGKDPSESQWQSFTFSTLDGGNVSAEEVEQARRDLDIRTFRQEYEATFENYANRIYHEFDRTRNIRVFTKSRDEMKVLHIGLDFNVGQMSATVFTQEGNIIHAIDEIALLSSNTAEMAEEIRNRYPKQQIIVYPDPSGTQRKSSASSGVTDHTILSNNGFIVKAPRAHNPVRDGINAVNSKLCNANGQTTLFIDPKCKKTIESLEKHTYKEGSSLPDKDSGYDHFSDAIRYYVDYVFPIKRNTGEYVPQRWGAATK